MHPYGIGAGAMLAHERTLRLELLALASEAVLKGTRIALPGIAGAEITAVRFVHRSRAVRCEKYHTVDFSSAKPYQRSNVGIEVKRRIDGLVHPPTSLNLVDYCMAEFKIQSGKHNDRWADLHTIVLRHLWNRDDWTEYEADMVTKYNTKEFAVMLSYVRAKWRNDTRMDHRDQFYQK